mmetsp:Transcript_1967/g.3115  ORF Transcript_1967/g.3115 Transcript_1967/m.3115 type:complete len:230 (+) Transcript_1967:718-1407(+)
MHISSSTLSFWSFSEERCSRFTLMWLGSSSTMISLALAGESVEMGVAASAAVIVSLTLLVSTLSCEVSSPPSEVSDESCDDSDEMAVSSMLLVASFDGVDDDSSFSSFSSTLSFEIDSSSLSSFGNASLLFDFFIPPVGIRDTTPTRLASSSFETLLSSESSPSDFLAFSERASSLESSLGEQSVVWRGGNESLVVAIFSLSLLLLESMDVAVVLLSWLSKGGISSLLS